MRELSLRVVFAADHIASIVDLHDAIACGIVVVEALVAIGIGDLDGVAVAVVFRLSESRADVIAIGCRHVILRDQLCVAEEGFFTCRGQRAAVISIEPMCELAIVIGG